MAKSNFVQIFLVLFLLGFSVHLVSETTDFLKPASKGIPDLTVSLQASRQVPVYPGDDIKNLLQVTVKNQGNGPATGFSLAVFLSKKDLGGTMLSPAARPLSLLGNGKIKVNSLAAGASLRINFLRPVTIPSNVELGFQYILVAVDSEGQVIESNEKNNVVSFPQTVWCRIENPIQQNMALPWTCGVIGIIINVKSGFSQSTQNVSVQVGEKTVAISRFVADPDQAYIECKSTPIDQIPLGQNPLYLVRDGKQVSNKVQIFWGILAPTVNPAQGLVGTSVAISCCNCWSQGEKKVYLTPDGPPYSTFFEMPVTSWSNDMVTVKIPNVPSGIYRIIFKNQGVWFSAHFIPQLSVQQ